MEAIPVLPLRFTYDERIDDGLNARFGMKSVVRVLSDPARWLGCLDADEAQHPHLAPPRLGLGRRRIRREGLIMSNERSPRILAEIPDLGIAIHKPSGLRMHPANADGEDDLVAWLGRQPDLPPQMAPAHRLDLGASGIVLCSPSAEGRRELARWFAEGLVQKTYLAVVHGRTHKKGPSSASWRTAGGRSPWMP